MTTRLFSLAIILGAGFFIGYFYLLSFSENDIISEDVIVNESAMASDAFDTSIWNKIDSGEFLNASDILPLKEFDIYGYTRAKQENRNIFLYFYSGWCSICVEELPRAMEALKKFNRLGILAFRVNFDDANTDETERVIAEELGVDHQYTKVFIKNGEVVLKDGNPWMAEDFEKNLELYFR